MPTKSKNNNFETSPDSTAKRNFRWITIISLYNDLYNMDSIPENRQFWSLCGPHSKSNKPIKGELGQLLEYKFISKEQYFGVDKNKQIIERNKKHFPDINWINGDFLEEMENAVSEGSFDPAIINYDGVMQPKNSVHYLKKIFSLLDYNYPNEVMLVSSYVLWNQISKNRYEIEDVLKELKTIYYMPDHWDMYPECYIYNFSHAKIGVMIFLKCKHDIKDIRITPNRIIGREA